MTYRRFAAPLFVLLACKSTPTDQQSVPPPTDPGAPAAGDPVAGASESAGDDVEPGAPGVPWEEKTFDQKKDFMGTVFFPAMKKSFKGHDEAQFQGFKCQTCHGDDMKERNFEMPTDSIYPLAKENTIEAAMEYDEEMTEFMVDVVVPESAKMLEEDDFGCFDCHPTE